MKAPATVTSTKKAPAPVTSAVFFSDPRVQKGADIEHSDIEKLIVTLPAPDAEQMERANSTAIGLLSATYLNAYDEASKLLKDNPSSANVANEDGWQPVHYAVRLELDANA